MPALSSDTNNQPRRYAFKLPSKYSHSNTMDDDLIQQLLLEEANLLDALQNGPRMLASYCQTSPVVSNALSAAMKAGDVGTETMSLAHVVASRISIVASCFLDVKRRMDLVTAQFQRDCDAVFNKMAALDLNANLESSQPDDRQDISSLSCSNTPTCSVESSSPFLAIAHQWLLDNLHNPYPTAETKAWMATASSCQVSSINSWFINARRRIGWTTLCRDHFSNCRADMADAAYRALVEEDPQRALPSELRHSFIAMKVAAEGLYSSTLTRSFFTVLDAIVKDTTEEVKDFAEVGKCGKVNEGNHTKAVQGSYPSPDPSTTASPVPALSDSLVDESEQEEDVAPPAIAGYKRRRSSIEPDNQRTASRPIKRLRASTRSQTCLPSPSSSTDVPPDDGSPVPCSVHPPSAETNQALPHLSDADATAMPKRPSDSTGTPHFNVIPDPAPCFHTGNDYSIDDWFNINFNDLFAIPPPVEAAEPDFSTSWEVELFKDYSFPGNPKYGMKCPPAPAADDAIAVSTDLSDIDSLLRSVGGDTFTTSDTFGAPYTVPFDSLIPEIPQTNIDWTSLFTGTRTRQPTVHSTCPQYFADSQPLPEIDLCMLQLPCVAPVANPQGDFASRQTRLYQLHLMQEAVRRMEQELRSEGVVW